MNRIFLLVLGVVLLASCGGRDTDTPKPTAYLRIDLPPHGYTLCDTTALPFTFERSNLSTIEWKKNLPNEKWFTVAYPKYKGYLFLTYKDIHGPKDLRAQIDTSYQFVEGHFSFSSGVDEDKFMDKGHQLYGTTYHLKGQNVASTYQFWITDSVSHFLRGALYIDCTPNNDSLAPVIEYLQDDVNHMIESVRWR